MITYSGSHVSQFTAEQGEDVILQHELHLVLVDLFLHRRRQFKKGQSHKAIKTTQMCLQFLNLFMTYKNRLHSSKCVIDNYTVSTLNIWPTPIKY